MPLSFRSESHGNIAFGFFNIESDMLLLENYFFFADVFCKWISQLSQQEGAGAIQSRVYSIADPNDIGDLMGAIHGVRFTGFIGRLYRRFPFPEDPGAFKQNPKGDQTRKIVLAEIEDLAEKKEILIELKKNGQVSIGSYLFDNSVFHELIQYVQKGGYPRWKDETMPPCVLEMNQTIQKSQNPFFLF